MAALFSVEKIKPVIFEEHIVDEKWLKDHLEMVRRKPKFAKMVGEVPTEEEILKEFEVGQKQKVFIANYEGKTNRFWMNIIHFIEPVGGSTGTTLALSVYTPSNRYDFRHNLATNEIELFTREGNPNTQKRQQILKQLKSFIRELHSKFTVQGKGTMLGEKAWKKAMETIRKIYGKSGQ